MINGNANELREELTYQDQYANYQGQKYYFNGCQCDTEGNVVDVTLEVYNLSANITVFSTTQNSIAKCIAEFEVAKIFDGKTFWEVEKDIEWIDC